MPRCVPPTFGLAVGAVLVVVLPQQFGQDGLMLLVQLLRLLSLRPRRHGGWGFVDVAAARRGALGKPPSRVSMSPGHVSLVAGGGGCAAARLAALSELLARR